MIWNVDAIIFQENCIAYPIKVMLYLILDRLKQQAQETITDEQAHFKAKRSTTEQMFHFIIGKRTISINKPSSSCQFTSKSFMMWCEIQQSRLPWGSTTSTKIQSVSCNSCVTRLTVQLSPMDMRMIPLLESDKDACAHLIYSILTRLLFLV